MTQTEPKPQRIQRQRTKGWKMPPNTVCVTRPGKWGNPFIIRPYPIGQWEVFDSLELTEESDPEPLLLAAFPSKVLAAQYVVPLFKLALIEGRAGVTVSDVRRELRGKNLACFCRLGTPCHADALLEIANSEER
jgi:hypothetical protein